MENRHILFILKAVALTIVTFSLIGSIFLYNGGISPVRVVVWNNEAPVSNNDIIRIPIEEMMKGPVSLTQDDASLIRYIRKHYLIQPSQEEYNLKEPTKDPSKGQSKAIKDILNNKKNGFFVECGALDGETRSNSLAFEKEYGWKGILIEGDPKNSALISGKNRKVFTVPACLSTVPYPNIVKFLQSFNLGKIVDNPKKKSSRYVDSQCLPLYSVLLAAGVTKVDYFSLDVEGHELEVLQTIPWNKVNITTLSVEFAHTIEGADALRQYMENIGYKVHSKVTHPGGLANDFIFYHPELLKEN